MPKFTFIAEHNSGQRVTYECEHDFLDHVLDDFNLFIRGVGFYPQGERLEFVSDEPYYTQEQEPEWHNEEFDTPQDDISEWDKVHSNYYFDTERNK
jgi:hypothetical protein